MYPIIPVIALSTIKLYNLTMNTEVFTCQNKSSSTNYCHSTSCQCSAWILQAFIFLLRGMQMTTYTAYDIHVYQLKHVFWPKTRYPEHYYTEHS